MSFLKSKHSGWTWDLKRTPFGRGGGGWNPIAAITDPISSALGTDGGGGGVLGALADIDPGPAIGQGLSEVDTFVNREIPGGWTLPAAIAAAYATGYVDPSLFASEYGTTIATEAGQDAFFTALSNGATSAEAINAGLAAETAAGIGAGGVAEAVTSTPGADAILNAPNVTTSLAPPTSGSFGSIVAPLEGSGAIPGAGATTLGGGGLTGALPAGVLVGDGTLGTTIGATYMATDAGTLATDMFGNAIPASSTGIGGFAADTGLSAADIAKNAKRLQSIVKLLGTGGTSVSGRAAPTAGQWATQAAQNFAQATPEQFGGYYQMNKNPFTFQNPLAAALKGSTSGLDVSGTSGQSLNVQNQASNLAKLLA
jgi:hypothetical protein